MSKELTLPEDLTLKQRKWMDTYLETGNATEAAMQSYNCKDRNSASQIGWENLRKLDFAHFMEKAGITDTLLMKKTLEGLEAGKIQRDYETGEIHKVQDYAVRHKYLETALELKGRKGKDANINIQVNLPILGEKDAE